MHYITYRMCITSFSQDPGNFPAVRGVSFFVPPQGQQNKKTSKTSVSRYLDVSQFELPQTYQHQIVTNSPWRTTRLEPQHLTIC